MTSERDAATAEETATPVIEEVKEETEIEKIQRERVEWERRALSAEGRVRQFDARAGENAESEDRLAKFFTESIETVLNEDDPAKRVERIKALGAQREAGRQMSTRITNTQIELDKLISDSAVDWDNDPDLADARQAWQDSKPEDALRLASLLVRERELKNDYVSTTEVDEIVETKLKNARQIDSTVDPGASTAAGGMPEKKPTNQTELVEYLRLARQNGIVIGKADRTALVRGAGGT